MTKKQTELSEELREAVFEAARAGAAEAYTQNTGYVNYFKAMETLLYNYKKLAALVADEEAYCEVEYHAGRKTFSTTPQAKGFIQRKTEAEIVEEMREEKQKQFKETKSGFDSLTRAISLFKGHKEFVVIRLYYFGEDINGNPREGGTATWEEIAEELSDAGVLKEIKTARRWRNKIVNDMAVCVFGRLTRRPAEGFEYTEFRRRYQRRHTGKPLTNDQNATKQCTLSATLTRDIIITLNYCELNSAG
jgi:hypothetical protein